MRTVRNIAFLLIVGIAFFGRSEKSWAATNCDPSLYGYGGCGDEEYAIYTADMETGPDCSDYCAYVPTCDPEASFCYFDHSYCEQNGTESDTWECVCRCVS